MKTLTNHRIRALKLEQAECDADSLPNGSSAVTLREAIVILLDHAEHTRTLRAPKFHQKRQIDAVDAVVNALEDFYPEVVDVAVEQWATYREQRCRDGCANLDATDHFIGIRSPDLETDPL